MIRAISIASWLLAGITLACVLPLFYNEYLINTDFGHVLLALPISVWMLYSRITARTEPEPGTISFVMGLILAAVSTVLLWGGWQVGDESIVAGALWLGVAGAILLLLGGSGLRHCLFPLALLAFCIPLPEGLTRVFLHLPLQRVAALSTAGMLSLFGYTPHVSNTILFIDSVPLNVAEACSGLKFLTTLVFVSVLTAGWMLSNIRWAQAMLILLAFPTAVLANVVRLSVAGAITASSGIEAAMAFLHGPLVLGIYGLTILLFFLFASLLRSIASAPTLEGEEC